MLSGIDYAILVAYSLGLVLLGYWVSREKGGHHKDSSDYFLAGRSLPWWAIGASLIAANISAEQIIGMSGSGYALGIAIATYEWTAAIALIVIGKFFLPILLDKGVFTMPQFLEMRFGREVRLVLAVFWLALYVFVNLTSVLYLGGLAIETVTGFDMIQGIVFLALLSLGYSLYGGLKAVALTDIVQVVLLVLGGAAVTWLALDKVADGAGPIAGFAILLDQAPEKFDMILDPSNPYYKDLPGVWVLFGGLWIAHFAYWGFNQYITQRALAAKSLAEAQKGIIFAAFLKILTPLIVVVPGIAAVLLAPDLEKPDQAYPHMMQLLPHGLLGLTFAALVAAIVSSLSSMTNSVSTIFTIDLYQTLFSHRRTSEARLVVIGRLAAVVALVIAVLVARPLLGQLDQAFQFIQNYSGFFTPGVLLIFLMAFFWKRANSLSALTAALTSFGVSLLFYKLMPDMPFLNRMGLAFLIAAIAAWAVTMLGSAKPHKGAINLGDHRFGTSPGFNAAALAVIAMVAGFYIVWW